MNEIIIDVRTKEEYRKGKLMYYSINIPLDEIRDKADYLEQFDMIKLVCLSGMRANRAKEILEDEGLENVKVISK